MVVFAKNRAKTGIFRCGIIPLPKGERTNGFSERRKVMSKLVMNINNSNNLKAMVAWCEQYHIEYQILEDKGNMPNLVDDTVKTTSKAVSKTADKPDPLKGVKVVGIGNFVRAYDEKLAVRYWDKGSFTPDKVKYGIKSSLKEAGATYSADLEAFVFSTKKAYTAWCKAQKARG